MIDVVFSGILIIFMVYMVTCIVQVVLTGLESDKQWEKLNKLLIEYERKRNLER